MTDIQQTRDQVADWLQMVIDKVGEITDNGDPSKFNMENYVSEWDSEHKCGTCCCVEGWLPVILSDKACWDITGATVVICGDDCKGFLPQHVGIPLTPSVWSYLTISGPANYVSSDPTLSYTGEGYSVIRKTWIEFIAFLRKGEIDYCLITTPS